LEEEFNIEGEEEFEYSDDEEESEFIDTVQMALNVEEGKNLAARIEHGQRLQETEEEEKERAKVEDKSVSYAGKLDKRSKKIWQARCVNLDWAWISFSKMKTDTPLLDLYPSLSFSIFLYLSLSPPTPDWISHSYPSIALFSFSPFQLVSNFICTFSANKPTKNNQNQPIKRRWFKLSTRRQGPDAVEPVYTLAWYKSRDSTEAAQNSLLVNSTLTGLQVVCSPRHITYSAATNRVSLDPQGTPVLESSPTKQTKTLRSKVWCSSIPPDSPLTSVICTLQL
jgi:hypothetical protein